MINKTLILMASVFILFVSFTEQKPKVLIIGDSISIGYTPFVKKNLADQAIVIHNRGNAKYTQNGLDSLDAWLGDEHFDVIQFNWGLWDLCYRNPKENLDPKYRDKIKGEVSTTKEEYQANLEAIVTRLEKTHAKLIFVTTT